ncbi:MAG: radical SAM protein, partial [Oscillospiraceae bacterium]
IRSKSLEDLKEELIAIAQNGYLEIVLVGINLSSYGKENGYKTRLIDAIELACSIDGVKRVRLGSLEPELLSEDDLIRMAKLDKFCPQFHLSLQSGSEETLKRMNRHYTPEEYYSIVKNIRSKFKNPAITTDIMVGFAGETEQEFTESLEFAHKIGFAKAHIFSYSIREGTKAALMPNQPDKQTKEQR